MSPTDPRCVSGSGRPAADRWIRVREVFDEVVDVPSEARERRLDQLCAGDDDLRREVASLIAHDHPLDDTVDRLLADAAAEALGRPATRDAFPATSARYRIIEALGEGGMGQVFLAEDTVLGRRVALKMPRLHSDDDGRARERLLEEARAAAPLNHPHVCIVHEVGDGPDGRPFIAMEFVEGETLSARLQRGRLPAADVIALGRQAADALAAAHALGVVHRDLKPSNIIYARHGIKLLDFGLASAARDADAGPAGRGLAGTVPYMSPEQVRAESLDHRTDLFSLGVVLYEAATGRLPFEATTIETTCEAIVGRDPVPPSQHAPDLPAELDRVIRHAIGKRRDSRYQSAAAFGEALEAAAPHSAGTTRWRRVAAVAAAVAAGVALAYGMRPVAPPARPPADMAILLADLTNATGDPSFDGTLRQGLLVQLQQTPFLRVFPAAGVTETLRQMTRRTDTPLTDAVAREIARRRNIDAWVSGGIEATDRGFAITLVAARGDSGEEVARERIEAIGKSEVLPALGTAAIRLRQHLGESLQSIRQFNAPIAQATTVSIDALKAYTLGAEQAARGDYAVAVALYERAVQIDPDFAMGYQALAREQTNGSYPRDVIAASASRAHRLRSRATEQERLSIETQFHASVTGAIERSIATADRWKATYPRDWRAHHALADRYFGLGRYPEAVAAGRQAASLNPDVAAVYSNLAAALFSLDRFDEAREVYRQAMARGLDAPEYHAFLWRIAYYTGDVDGMRRQIDWAAASSTWARNMPALAAGLQGRWTIARGASQDARALFARRQMPGLVELASYYERLVGALVGDCGPARRGGARVAARSDWLDETRAGIALAAALCGETAAAEAFVAQVRQRYPEDTALAAAWSPTIAAASAIGRGRPAEGVALLRGIGSYEDAAESWPIYVRGLALLQSGAATAAVAEFEKLAERRGRHFWFPRAPLARLGLARAHAANGDSIAARRAYERLFTEWKDADPDLPVLVEARAEYAKLR